MPMPDDPEHRSRRVAAESLFVAVGKRETGHWFSTFPSAFVVGAPRLPRWRLVEEFMQRTILAQHLRRIPFPLYAGSFPVM